MSNVFISHSSFDKPFVRRLATALLSEGFPIWLDSWELDLGDSLLDQIYDGIESSSMIILVLSQHAIESGWVNRELNAVLSKEQQLHRKFLIPIKIDICDPPLKIADRLYADFSRSFSAPITTLIDLLAANRCREFTVPPERELLSLGFTREVNLDIDALRKAFGHFLRRQGNLKSRSPRVVVNEDKECEILLHRLHARIDNISTDPYYSPQLERMLRGTLNEVLECYRYLSEGVVLLLMNQSSFEAVYWFSKIVRGRIVYNLWEAQLPGADDSLDYGKGWKSSGLYSDVQAASFFETDRVEMVDIFTEHGRASGHYFNVWIGTDEAAGLRDTGGCYDGPASFFDACRGSAGNKYVYPQMVLQKLRLSEARPGPIIWRLEEAIVGLH